VVRGDDEPPARVRHTAGVPTLRAVVEVLGPAVTAAGDLDVEVSDVVLVGPGDPVPSAPGALLVVQDPAGLREVTAAAVVVRGAVELAVGVPVLCAAEDLPWNHLLQLLTSAVSGSGGSGDLFALANSIAAMVGGAVAIEDPARRVLAYSSLADQVIDGARQQGILGRQVPDLSGNDTIYRDLQRAPGVLRVPASGDVLPRLAVAVRAGAELLGSIWVVEAEPLPAAAEQALLDAGRLAALHLLRARAGSEIERRARGELLRGLLDGRSAPEIAATRLGLSADTPVAVLGFALPPDVAGDELGSDAVADVVQLQCAAVRPRSSVLVQLGTVYALVPDLPRAALRSLAQTVVQRARVALAGAVGATVGGLHEVARSRQDVDAVLRLVPPGGVAAVEEVLPQVVLLHLHAHLAGQPHLRLPSVERMVEHDREQQTPYVESVLAYLSANADVPAAAGSVSVHPNTFRYRLRRVRELFDIDLEDPDVRLVVWLQLRTRRS
jgi:hypothetical protein